MASRRCSPSRESCLAALLGTVAGLFVGLLAIFAIADRTDLPAGALARHALGSPLALALVAGCGVAAAGLVAGRLLVAEADDPHRARVTALDVAAIASALAVVLALVRGPATVDELRSGQGAGIILLALPALVALATGVALARLLGPLTRLAERAGRGTGAAPRLALLALARGRGRTSATAAFLAVSTGLAVFAVVYGATLSEGDRDQAAFRVPLDFTASQGSSLTRPLGAASLADWRRLAPGAVRAAGAAPLGGRRAARRLLRVARRARRAGRRAAEAPLDRSCRSRPLPGGRCGERSHRAARRPFAASGSRLTRASSRCAARASGEPVDLTLTVATPRGDIDLVPLRATGSTYRGAVPRSAAGGLVIALAFDQTEGNSRGNAHQAAEGVQVASSGKGVLELGRLEADGRPIGSLQRFIGRGNARVRVHAGATEVRFTLNGAARAYIRPREPFDTRALPVLASPDLARSAGTGRVLALQIDGVTVRARVVATSSRFPTETEAPFLVADQQSLSTAMAADSPADSLPSELWLGVPASSAARVARSLGQPPYSTLELSSRRAVERSLQEDPLARGLVLALAAGAALALLLALAGLLLAVTSDLRDEQGTLADLEAQGLAPADLRVHVRLRAAMLVAAGLVGGLGVGAALVLAVHDALLSAATIGDPVPPLQTAIPWAAIAVGVLALSVIAGLAVEGPLRLALRGESPRRGPGGGW